MVNAMLLPIALMDNEPARCAVSMAFQSGFLIVHSLS